MSKTQSQPNMDLSQSSTQTEASVEMSRNPTSPELTRLTSFIEPTLSNLPFLGTMVFSNDEDTSKADTNTDTKPSPMDNTNKPNKSMVDSTSEQVMD